MSLISEKNVFPANIKSIPNMWQSIFLVKKKKKKKTDKVKISAIPKLLFREFIVGITTIHQ